MTTLLTITHPPCTLSTLYTLAFLNPAGLKSDHVTYVPVLRHWWGWKPRSIVLDKHQGNWQCSISPIFYSSAEGDVNLNLSQKNGGNAVS